jgi:hypothetical protein
MGFDTTYIEDGLGLQFAGIGVLTGREVLDCNHALLETPESLSALEYAIVLLDDVTSFPATTNEIHELVDVHVQLSRVNPSMLVAIVAPSDFLFGMARMWETLAAETGWSTAIFRSRQEADAWIAGGRAIKKGVGRR